MFIEGIGTYNVGSEKTPRRVWLEGYAAALPLRQDWGSMDREVITQATRASLERTD